jgi:hypothetical protein
MAADLPAPCSARTVALWALWRLCSPRMRYEVRDGAYQVRAPLREVVA